MRLGDLDKAEAVLRNIADHLKENGDEDLLWASAYTAADVIKRQPSVDAAPVRHGAWKRSIDNDCAMHKCSLCGARVVKELYEYENPNLYCYHCGARMDGGD